MYWTTLKRNTLEMKCACCFLLCCFLSFKIPLKAIKKFGMLKMENFHTYTLKWIFNWNDEILIPYGV